DGRFRVEFYDADGKRKCVSLGTVSDRYAERFRDKVTALAQVSRYGSTLAENVARWLAGLNDREHRKLVKAGLVSPRETPAEPDPETTKPETLVEFVALFITKKASIKKSTQTFYGHTAANLREFFGLDKRLTEVTQGDADDFREFLVGKYSEATVNRRCGVTKTILKSAVRHRLISINPFDDLRTTVRGNKKKRHMIDRATTERILDACPNAEWRVLVALARFAGMRIPSEAFYLRWNDIDWDRERIRFRSPKTEHKPGHEEREIPLFPELVEPLRDAQEQAEPGSEFVITKLRPATLRDDAGNFRNTSLSTRFKTIIRRAGLVPWPKPFVNLRASRDTELRESFPGHVVEAWIGHGDRIAKEHYLMVTDDHFRRASENRSENRSGTAPNQARIVSQKKNSDPDSHAKCKEKRPHADSCDRSSWAILDSNQ
nr:site-specific integrase [Planctomycetota bacterium]